MRWTERNSRNGHSSAVRGPMPGISSSSVLITPCSSASMMRDPEAVHLVAQLLDDPQRFALLVDIQRQRIVRVVETPLQALRDSITAIFPRNRVFGLLTAALSLPCLRHTIQLRQRQLVEHPAYTPVDPPPSTRNRRDLDGLDVEMPVVLLRRLAVPEDRHRRHGDRRTNWNCQETLDVAGNSVKPWNLFHLLHQAACGSQDAAFLPATAFFRGCNSRVAPTGWSKCFLSPIFRDGGTKCRAIRLPARRVDDLLRVALKPANYGKLNNSSGQLLFDSTVCPG